MAIMDLDYIFIRMWSMMLYILFFYVCKSCFSSASVISQSYTRDIAIPPRQRDITAPVYISAGGLKEERISSHGLKH